MTDQEIKKLRQYYHSLNGMFRVLDDFKKQVRIEHFVVSEIFDELRHCHEQFPGLLPETDEESFFSGTDGRGIKYYYTATLRAHLQRALGRLKIDIDETKQTVITESRDFSFLKDPKIRQILERDYLEIQRAFIAECWKSVIILCGGAIEAILTDILLDNEEAAKSSSKAPSRKAIQDDILKWDLNDLIEVAVDLKLVTPGIDKFSHSLREYRNLIHPGKEVRSGITFDVEESRIAFEVLNMLYRDLQ